jgi:hypothetical protein
MARNGSGTAIPPVSVNPVAPGTVITSNWANTTITDTYNELTNSLPRDGQAPMLAPLKVIDGSNTIPGVAFNSESATGLYRPSSGNLAITVAGVEGLRVNSGGRTLVATTSDDGSSKLQVGGNAAISGNATVGGTLGVTSNATFGGTLTVTGTATLNGGVSGTGITSLFASPPAIGGTAPNAGAFTTLTASGATTLNGTLGGAGFTSLFASPPAIGSTTPNTGAFSGVQLGNSQYISSKTSGGTSTRIIGINGSNDFYLGGIDAAVGSMFITSGGTTRMLIDSNSNVGIGRTPSTTLDIQGSGLSIVRVRGGTSSGQGSAYYGTQAGTDTTLFALGDSSAITGGATSSTVSLYTANAVPLLFLVSTTEKMRLDASGNLGLGVTPSGWSGSTALQFGSFGTLAYVGASPTAEFGLNYYYNGSNYVAKASCFAPRYAVNGSTGSHAWFNTSGNSVTGGSSISYTQAMTLDNSGNLGLGITPSSWGPNRPTLEFGGSTQGTIAFNGNNSNGYAFWTNSYYDGSFNRYKNNGWATLLSQPSTGGYTWNVAPSGTAGAALTFTEAMRLDLNGNLLLGGTSNPSGYKQVTYGGSGLVVGSGSDSPSGGKAVWVTQDGGSTYNAFAWQLNSSSGASLFVGNGSNAWNEVLRTTSSGTFTYNGIEVGYRDVPRTTGGLTRGQCFSTGSGFTVNTGLTAGSCYSIFNNSTSAITVTQGSGLTLRLAGTTTTGNRTIAGKGMATIWVESTTEYIMSGAGVT